MPADARVGESATAELFRLRRGTVVSNSWHLGFISGFGLAGILSLNALTTNLGRAPGKAMGLYIISICVAGLMGGALGAACGHGVATLWERWDLQRHPRRYEG